ncbi:Zn-dependent protease with chaperone function [Caulobacter sp. D4A]|uniref:M48 family metallopeptidase n=1 Tax=unclassified Caulobacter TaxID=2648921 RepID=UPI000D735CB0|nr:MULTISPECIES: M48 family metallopeptidase [unclassified Caulobacter]PXA85490.1 Zn-dependent protease with chaperone function [Caulobacter sp. D4A]PXA89621.1 Zn-dependent protease with chaperone function [Caulobacter sp. D5]
MLRRPSLALFAVLASTAALSACAYNAELGRDQFAVVDDAALARSGEQAWGQALRTGKISQDPRLNARVERVGQRVVTAAGLADRPWDYVVFDNPVPNAFVLPGGHVGVNSGLVQLVDNDDQLAAVLGHEAAHVVARHAAERYSQQMSTQLVLAIAQAAAGGGTSDGGKAVSALGGAGAQVGFLLPFSRKHELEADRLGVDFMQRAGYRPREAVALWRKMQAQGGSNRAEFTSTHPSDATRIQALETYIASRGW